MRDHEQLDEVDHAILERLRRNGRASAASIATKVNLTDTAVRRRIKALEDSGVIAGYTIAVNHDRVGVGIEAYVEFTFPGDTDVHAAIERAASHPSVREAMTVSGGTDALVLLRVHDIGSLRRTVMELRADIGATSSDTRIVLGRWDCDR